MTLIRIAASGAANNPPAPTAAPMQFPQGNSGSTQVVANDPDAGNTFTYRIAAAAQHGTASISADGLVRYTPATRTFQGSDSVTVVVTDNANASGSVVIPITVFSITWSGAPIATDDSASVSRNRTQVINLLANDRTDSGSLDPAAVVITTPPAHGRVTLNRSNGMATYKPREGYVGNDRFSYTVKNTLGAVSNVASVSITVKK
jgi:large repetitive protein